ncbi:DUF4332 domain-containing protein [Amphibiibacter pelophylacis]|uniref:DUF4332 domain-containing protein n=1 Tax=Amphibiibacter pelophylacis TaxID=1799477 RepID=A0ACC6P2Q0_9BURK
MANYKIEEVEGIGPVTGEKLRAQGVTNTDGLLKATTTPAQRKALAAATGMSEAQVLKFANMVDLFRINGVGAQFAELLQASGVNTVVELSKRNAANLAAALETLNAEKKLTRRVPTEAEVTQWVEEAKTLPRVLQY